MLSIQSKYAVLDSDVGLEISQTDGAGGIQFELFYDSSMLQYVSWQDAPTLSSVINPSEPGRFRYAVAKAEALPELLGVITFRVGGSSLLTFSNVVAGDPQGNALSITAQPGVVEIKGETMLKGFKWTDQNPPGKVVSWSFLEALDGEPLAVVVSNISAASRRLDYDIDTNVDLHEFAMIAHGGFKSSDLSNILVVDASAPLPPVLEFE